MREIREAMAADKPCTVRLLNYRKDGTPFWNNLHVSPIRNAGGKVSSIYSASFATEMEPYSLGLRLRVFSWVGCMSDDAAKRSLLAIPQLLGQFFCATWIRRELRSQREVFPDFSDVAFSDLYCSLETFSGSRSDWC